MKILVTGAAGFIGYHLSQELLHKDIRIVGIDNMNDYYDSQLKEDRLSLLNKHENFSFHKTDLKDKEDIDNLFEDEKPSHVVHLAVHTDSHLYNIPTTGLRIFTVYGPFGRPDMAYFKFTKK